MDSNFELQEPLAALGELLAHAGDVAAIVVVGGTALNLLGIVQRATADVDVIAAGVVDREAPPRAIQPPDSLPPGLQAMVARVARDFALAPDWLNTVVGSQWETGLPPGFGERVSWTRHGGLWIGLPGRIDLVFLKLYAAADDIGPTSRHFTDLLALRPTQEELDAAVAWIRGTQDPSAAFSGTLDMVVQNVRQRTR